jgi:hypothetical protein
MEFFSHANPPMFFLPCPKIYSAQAEEHPESEQKARLKIILEGKDLCSGSYNTE